MKKSRQQQQNLHNYIDFIAQKNSSQHIIIRWKGKKTNVISVSMQKLVTEMDKNNAYHIKSIHKIQLKIFGLIFNARVVTFICLFFSFYIILPFVETKNQKWKCNQASVFIFVKISKMNWMNEWIDLANENIRKNSNTYIQIRKTLYMYVCVCAIPTTALSLEYDLISHLILLAKIHSLSTSHHHMYCKHSKYVIIIKLYDTNILWLMLSDAIVRKNCIN